MPKRRLLLADDSVTIQKVVNLTFADEGIEVITVGDGDTAMERISENKPDVVLADVHMPGLSGYQICEIVRADPAMKDLPIILLVGSFEPFDEEEAARVGANAYLTKPFQSIRQLVSQVTELMESTAAPAEEDVTEFVPTTDVPDTGDIESLIQRSFNEAEPEGEETEAGPPRYVDAGMDDEMIETSHVGEGDEPDVPTADVSEVDETQDTYHEAYAQSGAAAANQSFDSSHGDATAMSAMAKDVVESTFDEFSATEQIPSGDVSPTDIAFDLDETDILELPPIEDGKTLEFTTPQKTDQGDEKEVVNVSPELMEILVQKVVDKLSKKY